MDKSTLDTILEYDEHNLGESRKMFRDYGLLDPFERMPGLLESLRLAIEPHLAADPHALGRPDTSGTLKPRYDTILRVYMHLSAWHQFVMTTGHLFRGHVSEVFKDVRRAVEAAGIAYLAKTEPDLGDVFVSGDRDAMRNRTTRGKLFPHATTDELLRLLGDTWEHGSEQSHNNFSSFVARVTSNTFIGQDGRAHFKTDFPIYEMEDHARQEEGSEVHGLLHVTHHGVDAVCTSSGAGPWSARLGFSRGTAAQSRRSPGRGFWNAGSGHGSPERSRGLRRTGGEWCTLTRAARVAEPATVRGRWVPLLDCPARSGSLLSTAGGHGTMAGREEDRTTLATRIPKPLHRQLKLHCVEEGVLVMDFVVAAIEERLRKKGAERKGRAG
jgi:hypothetical protein